MNKLLQIVVASLFLIKVSVAQTSLVFPPNNWTQLEGNVSFSWNGQTEPYELSFSTNELFTSPTQYIVHRSDTMLNMTSGNYFWRVRTLNPAPSPWSNYYGIHVFKMETLGQLAVWLDANYGVQLTGANVSAWADRNASGYNLSQATASLRPQRVDTVLNHLPSIYFSGLTQIGNVTAINVGSYFTVLRHDNTTNVGVVGLSGATANPRFIFSLNNGNTVNVNSYSAFNASQLRVNMQSNLTMDRNNWYLVSGVRATPVAFANMQVSPTHSGYNRLKGDITEKIIFSNALPDTSRTKVENYLRFKYSPPVNLGKDINIIYGNCPVILKTANHILTNLWSDGSTGNSLVVNTPGTYWVEGKDVFGLVSRDTINISFPAPQLPTATLFCPGQSASWNTGLGSNYSYLWNNGVTTENIIISTPGYYHVTITDTNGCQRVSDSIYFNEDPFHTTVSLGADQNLCAGNTIGLVSGSQETISYIWNTGDTTASILINTTGNYSVIVDNANGCTATDTIHVNIVGSAPVVQSNLDSSYCEGVPFNYQDLSTTTDGSQIVTRSWDFGNGDASSDIGGEYAYPLPGQYNVTLNVVTDAGCFNTAIQSITIFPRPDVDFYTTTGCPNQPVTFNFDFVNSTNVAQWYWDFGVPSSFLDTSTDTNGVWTYNQSGLYSVFLRGTSAYGCSDSITKTITIKPSATPNFSWQGLCYGNPTQFFNQSIPENGTQVTGYEWNFGPGVTSSFINPAVVFDSANVYPVSLKIFTASGCSETVTLQVPVNKGVNAAFDLADSLCANENINLLDQSQGVNDNIVSWVWRFGGNTTISGQSPTFAFQNTGNRIVRLTTVTSTGCADSTQQNVFVRPAAEANFSLTINGGTPPFKPVVTNLTTTAVSYAWYIDGVLFSNAFEPVFPSYTDTGTYQIMLVAENAAGCSSEIEKSFVVFTGDRTLQLIEANCLSEGDFMKYSARVFNKGALEVSEITFGANTDYNSVIREVWTGSLMPGQVLDYQLQSSAKYYTSADFCCVRIDAFNDTLKVQSPDNEICLPLTEQAWFSVPYPTPTNGMVTVDYIFPFADKFSATLCEIDGKVIKNLFTNQSAAAGFGSFTSDISDVKAGMYIIRLAYRDRFFSVKVIKQ